MNFYLKTNPLLPWGTDIYGFSQQQQKQPRQGSQALHPPTNSPQQAAVFANPNSYPLPETYSNPYPVFIIYYYKGMIKLIIKWATFRSRRSPSAHIPFSEKPIHHDQDRNLLSGRLSEQIALIIKTYPRSDILR